MDLSEKIACLRLERDCLEFERDVLKVELARIKAKYDKHLDFLQKEIIRLKEAANMSVNASLNS